MQRVDDERRDGEERLMLAQHEHAEAADRLRAEAEVRCGDAARAGALEARAAVEEVRAEETKLSMWGQEKCQ